MTAKQREKQRLNISDVLEYDVYIEFQLADLITKMNDIIQKYSEKYTNIRLYEHIDYHWGEESKEWQIRGDRKETDEEMDARLKKYNDAIEDQRLRDLAKLAELTAKYGKQ